MGAFQSSYHAVSPHNAALMRLFHEKCEKYGLVHDNQRIFEYLSEFEDKNSREAAYLLGMRLLRNTLVLNRNLRMAFRPAA